MSYSVREQVSDAAWSAGKLLHEQYPAVELDGFQLLPHEAIEPVTDAILTFASAILQVWLDAGSERESTEENLHAAVLKEVRSWSIDSSGGNEFPEWDPVQHEFPPDPEDAWKVV